MENNLSQNKESKDIFALVKKLLGMGKTETEPSSKEILGEYSQTTSSPGNLNGFVDFDTNLIKNEVTAFFSWKKNFGYLFFSIFIPIIVLVVCYGGLLYWQNSEQIASDSLSSDIKAQSDMISIVEAEVDKAVVFQKKILAGKDLLQKHVRWTNFFKLLEDNTLADVTFKSISGDLKGEYALDAIAKKGFYVAAEQVKLLNLENKYIVSADSEGGEKKETDTGSEINFKINLKVKPDIFTSDYASGNQ